MFPDDLQRLKDFYLDRDVDLAENNKYSFFNQSYLFTIQQRSRNVLALLRKSGFEKFSDYKILEVGCGTGGVLLEYLAFGANSCQLHGCDLMPHRLQYAREKLPSELPLVAANGQHLPYRSQAFNLVMQYTVFSSILSAEIKRDLAEEMRRVLKPGGMILWYDFWLNPTNPQTKGIRPLEIRQLFPSCRIELHKITLAPPLTRFLVKVSWMMCLVLEKCLVFNTHYLAMITPE